MKPIGPTASPSAPPTHLPPPSSPAAGRFALWSGDYSLVTGQAAVTARAAALLRRREGMEFIYRGAGLAMLMSWLLGGMGLWRAASLGRLQTVYMVCSRSNAGFLRDLPAYLMRWLGVRVVVHVHGSDIVDLLLRRGIGRIALHLIRPCELILPSQHLLDPLAKLGLRHLHVCENFVAESRPPDDRTEPAEPPAAGRSTMTVIWNSNILASKGFFLVAEAVAAMHRDGQPVRLIVLGSAMADSRMSARQAQQGLDELKLQPWIELRGSVDRATSTRLLEAADVVCLPSTYSSECQPLAVIEAMCAGKKLIIANTAALRATVGAYPCELLEAVDARSVRAALERLAKSPPDRYALEAAAGAARARFSAQRFDAELTSILDSALTALPPVAVATGARINH